MAISIRSSIIAPNAQDGGHAELIAAAMAYVDSRSDLGPVINRAGVQAYVTELARLAQMAGMRFITAFAQACDECNVFRDAAFWGKYGNPIGYGAEETLERPGDINYVGGKWTPVGAARVHLVHLYLYAGGTDLPPALEPYQSLDIRWNGALPYAGLAPTLEGLSGRWAANLNYANQIAAHANRAFPGKAELPVANKPRILLTRGHGTTGDTGAFAGGQSEEVHNKRIVPAIAAALRSAGYLVTTYPANPADDVPGTLDTEASFARQWCQSLNGSTGVMIDCHLESSSARGIFGIVANDVGLETAAPGLQPATDNYAGNVGDIKLCKAIVASINKRSGIPIRTVWVKEPGVMSEDMTYVGGQGWRLAMFGYTAEFHTNVYRLVVEFGNLQNDGVYYTSGGFPEHCGAGVLEAINSIFGQAPTEIPNIPAPVPGKLSYPPGLDKALAESMFGRYISEGDGKIWQFSENGSVSKLWLTTGAQTGRYPRIVTRDQFDTREYFIFADGLIIWRANEKERFRVLKG
jgi:hypothetical protein